MNADRWNELKKVGPKDRMFKSVIRSSRWHRKVKVREVTDEETGQKSYEDIGKHAFIDGRPGTATKPPASSLKRRNRARSKAARLSRKLNRG